MQDAGLVGLQVVQPLYSWAAPQVDHLQWAAWHLNLQVVRCTYCQVAALVLHLGPTCCQSNPARQEVSQAEEGLKGKGNKANKTRVKQTHTT